MLGKRVISAIVAIAFLVIMLWIGGWFFNLALLLVSLIGMHEIYRGFEMKGIQPLKTAGYLAMVLFYLQHFLFQGKYDFFYLLIAVIVLLSLQVFRHSVEPNHIAVTVLGLFYPGILLVTASLMKEEAFVNPNYLLILTIVATFSTDTFAYFVGKAIGKRKLCPAISPKKTIAGSIGGGVASLILVTVLGFVLNWVYNISINPIHFVLIGLLGGTFSQIGDLTASAIKRYCGLKNYGNIMPGHGGILDRIDSLLFVLPVVYVYSQVFLAG